MAFWRKNAAISLKRVKMEEKLLWRAYWNSPTLFRTVPFPALYGLAFLQIGGLQLSYPLLSQEQVKLLTSNLASTFTGPIRIKAHSKFWRKWSAGVFRDCPKFLGTPCCRRNESSYGLQIWRVHLQGNPNKSILKLLKKRVRDGRVQGLPNFLGTKIISVLKIDRM